MHHRLQSKTSKYKISSRKYREMLCTIELDKHFLDTAPKAQSVKENG